MKTRLKRHPRPTSVIQSNDNYYMVVIIITRVHCSFDLAERPK